MIKKLLGIKSNFFLIPAAILLAGVLIGSGIALKNWASEKPFNPDEEKNALPLVGYFAPSFLLKTADETEISLNDLYGKNVLLVFWSTTCSYSAKELEDLKKFADAYQGKIIVVAIMFKDLPQTAKEYQTKNNINFTMLLDPNGEIADKYKIDGTPAHFFINSQGKIAAIVPDYTPFDVLLVHAREIFNAQ